MKINDASGKSLLSLACDNKFTNAEIIEYLLEKGCDPFTLDTNQGNGTCVQKLLLAPIYTSDVVRATEKLISKMTEISPEETTKFLNLSTLRLDQPIGMMASKWKDTKEEIEIVKMLINAGANPQLRFGFESKSSIMYLKKEQNRQLFLGSLRFLHKNVTLIYLLPNCKKILNYSKNFHVKYWMIWKYLKTSCNVVVFLADFQSNQGE